MHLSSLSARATAPWEEELCDERSFTWSPCPISTRGRHVLFPVDSELAPGPDGANRTQFPKVNAQRPRPPKGTTDDQDELGKAHARKGRTRNPSRLMQCRSY